MIETMILSMNVRLLDLFTLVLITAWLYANASNALSFNENYEVTWGSDHALLLNRDTDIQLSLDNVSGTGFQSKGKYGSGLFHMRIKLPGKNSLGVITAFYLISNSNVHDELDLEFLGSNGPPYLLHTNVYTIGQGGREQRIRLWFDPTKDFHSYKILLNQNHVVFYVDDKPIRVFKDNTKLGVSYVTQPMQIEGSIWKAEGWASDGRKVDWSQAPFKANFQDFNIDGCVSQGSNTALQCKKSSNFQWNGQKFWKLSSSEEKSYENVRKNIICNMTIALIHQGTPNRPQNVKVTSSIIGLNKYSVMFLYILGFFVF